MNNIPNIKELTKEVAILASSVDSVNPSNVKLVESTLEKIDRLVISIRDKALSKDATKSDRDVLESLKEGAKYYESLIPTVQDSKLKAKIQDVISGFKAGMSEVSFQIRTSEAELKKLEESAKKVVYGNELINAFNQATGGNPTLKQVEHIKTALNDLKKQTEKGGNFVDIMSSPDLNPLNNIAKKLESERLSLDKTSANYDLDLASINSQLNFINELSRNVNASIARITGIARANAGNDEALKAAAAKQQEDVKARNDALKDERDAAAERIRQREEEIQKESDRIIAEAKNAVSASDTSFDGLVKRALSDTKKFREEYTLAKQAVTATTAAIKIQNAEYEATKVKLKDQRSVLIDLYNKHVSSNDKLASNVGLDHTLLETIKKKVPALAEQVESYTKILNLSIAQKDALNKQNAELTQQKDKRDKMYAAAQKAGIDTESAWSKVLNSARVGIGGIQGGISGLFSQMSFSLSSLLGNSKEKIAGFLDRFLKPGFLAVAGVIVSLTKSAVGGLLDAFKPFEFKSAQLASILGTTRDKINDLDNSAKQLARDTMWTVGQIQELQISLAKLGFRADEIRDATKAIQQMATAMDSDLAAAANLAGTAIRAWNLDASEAGRVASTLAVATTKCALDFQKLDMSLPYVSNAAATLGWTVEETTALLGKLADQGMKTSTMGTSLRSIMLKLSDPMSKLSKQLGNPKTFQEFLKGLKECQEAGYDLGTMLELTDKRSVNAFAALTRNADAVRNLTASITDCEAEMAKMEETRLNTFEGRVKLLESAWDNFKVSLSETSVFLGIISILESCLTGLTNFMNGVWHSKDAIERTEDKFNSAKSALDEATSSYERYMSILKNSNEYTHSTVLKTIAELNSLIGETAVSYNEATKQIEFNTEALKNWSETFSKTLKQKAAWDSLDDIQKQIDEYNSKIDSIIADTGLTREQAFDIANVKNVRRVRTSGSTFYRYKERQNLYAYQVDKVLSNRELFSTLQDLESKSADIVKEYGTRPVQEEPEAPTHEDFVKQLNNFNRVDSDLKSSDLPDKEKADDAKAAKSAALSAMRANLNNRRQTEGDTAQFKQDWETYRKLQNQFDAESGRSGKGNSTPKDQYTKLDWRTAAYRLEENSHNRTLNNLNEQQVLEYLTPTQYQRKVNDENIRYNNAQIEAIKSFQKAEGLDAGTFDINTVEVELDNIHNVLLNASSLSKEEVERKNLEKKMLEDKKKLWSESEAELQKHTTAILEIMKSYGTAYEKQQAEIALDLLEATNKYKNQMTDIEHEIQAKQGKSGIYSALGLFDPYASDIRDLKVQSATVERNSLDIQRKEIQRKITEKQNEISILEVSAPNSAILTKAKTELSELQQSLKEFEENYRSITDKIKQANLELVDSFNSTLDKFSSVLSKFDLSTQSFGSTFSNVQKQVAEAMKAYTESVTKSDAFQSMDADKQEAWLKGNADKQQNINALTWSFTQLANVTDTMMQLDKQKLDEDVKNGKISEKEAKKRLKSMAYTQAAVSLASYLASTGLQMYEIWRSPSLELWSKIAMTVATAASTIATGYATYESIRRIGDGGSASVSSNVATLSTQSEYGQQQTTYALVGESGNSSVADAVNSSAGGSTPVLVVETLHDVESNMNNVAIQSNY